MNINKLKEIVENAPEGATHVNGRQMYYGSRNKLEESRSLEDIRTIIELYEGLQNAIEACYDLDSFGVRETNTDYINAYKLLERFE